MRPDSDGTWGSSGECLHNNLPPSGRKRWNDHRGSLGHAALRHDSRLRFECYSIDLATPITRICVTRSPMRQRVSSRTCPKKPLVQQPVEDICGRRLRVQDRWLVSFVSASYPGLEQDARVKQAVGRTARFWGVSLSTPRVLAHDPVTVRLEAAIERLTGRPGSPPVPFNDARSVGPPTPSFGIVRGDFLRRQNYPTSLDGVRKEAKGSPHVSFPPQ